jgi:uncharacterized protein DUF3558
VANRAAVWAAVGLLALGMVAACSNPEPGSAVPDDSSTSGQTQTNSPSSGSGPTVEIPARPAELPLDDVEPCSLFTKAQLTQLGIDQEPEAGTNDGQLKGPTCTIEISDKEPFYNYTAQLITDRGIDFWLTGKTNVDAWLVSVGEYPAVDFKTKGVDDQECVTTVDVADGQQLMVDVSPLDEVDYKKLCPMSERVAGMALQTLQTLK